MIGEGRGVARLGFASSPLLLTSCSRAPSFDILGSYFPAWLVCLVLAILSTAVFRWLLLREGVVLIVPIVVYPSLAASVAFSLWLLFFR